MRTPIRKFTVSGPNAAFLQRMNDLVERVNELSNSQSSGEFVSHTTKGVFRRPRIRAKAGGASGSSEMRFRGEYSTETVYLEGDVVVVRGGVTAGTYISNTDGNTDTPDNSANWTQLADNNSIGRWGG